MPSEETHTNNFQIGLVTSSVNALHLSLDILGKTIEYALL